VKFLNDTHRAIVEAAKRRYDEGLQAVNREYDDALKAINVLGSVFPLVNDDMVEGEGQPAERREATGDDYKNTAERREATGDDYKNTIERAIQRGSDFTFQSLSDDLTSRGFAVDGQKLGGHLMGILRGRRIERASPVGEDPPRYRAAKRARGGKH
jgi:hypothetical protein